MKTTIIGFKEKLDTLSPNHYPNFKRWVESIGLTIDESEE